MKRTLTWALVSLVCAVGAGAATVPIYVNDSPTAVPPDQLPTINATSFVNQSTFSIDNFGFGIGGIGGGGIILVGNSLPYEMFNTRFYTNEASGFMYGNPGFRFLWTVNRTRRPATWFVSEGAIDTTSYLEIKATNVVISGPLSSGPDGLIRIAGKNVDLTQVGLRTGSVLGGSFFGGQNFLGSTNYFNAGGVTDLYWGIGSNGMVNAVGNPTPLNSPDINFNLPDGQTIFSSPSTPQHQVLEPFLRRIFTNTVDLPKFGSFFASGFGAFAYTNIIGGTAALVQVVFVRTNNGFFGSLDTNFSATVRFSPSGFGPAKALVEYRISDFDLALGAYSTNLIYITDNSAVVTNFSLYRPSITPNTTRRPNVHEVLRSTPFDWDFGSVLPNTPFTNGMLTTGYLSNRVGMRYAAYSAHISASGVSNTASASAASSPTNLPGRVEIFGDKLNLDSTRIRSESTVIIKTKDLSSNRVARLDAPYMSFDLTSKQPQLIISNLAPSDVHRLSGDVCVWSGIWENFKIDPANNTTNPITFHVMFVDHSLQTFVPVQVFDFFAHATNLVIRDQLNITKAIALDSRSLDVEGAVNFPFGAAWGRTNVPQLLFFTNNGVINVPGSAKYGTDRTAPYTVMVNNGTNTAASQFVRSTRFDNSGCFQSSAGPILIDSVTSTMRGVPFTVLENVQTQFIFTNGFQIIIDSNGFPVTILVTNLFTNTIGAKVASSGDLQIKARDLTISNSVLIAGLSSPGRLIISATNALRDEGAEAINHWSASAGFQMLRRPATSSLLGTWLTTTIGANQSAIHTWPGQDLGAVAAGYTNNLGLGKLTIDVSTNNGRATFRSVSGNQALYVDYVELLNDATNFNRTLAIFPNLTIYFANANVSVEKLDGAVGGRFRWVPSFAGPLSTTNLLYPSGNRYAFNIALIASLDIDSNNNGIPNALDPYPVDIPGEIIPPLVPRLLPASVGAIGQPLLGLRVNDKVSPTQAVLSWNASAYSRYSLEFKTSLADPGWMVLTNFVNGPVAVPVSINDPITGPARMRLYRLQAGPSSER
ncbi:MAG: hypothetical protein QOF48_731 [Verrucomicrobiota bacterium]|jgi:hypothetical protein